MDMSKEIYVPAHIDGQRLDNAIILVFPSLSLRARRRLWQDWYIYVDDNAKGPGYRVKTGQKISFRANPNTIAPSSTISNLEQPYLIKHLDGLSFIYKPRGLHSTYLDHGGASLECNLSSILGQQSILCNRLDAQTSGIIVTAKDDLALKHWQDLESMGQCQKHYIALVQGNAHNCTINAALDTSKRKVSKVLESSAPALRHTHFQVLAKLNKSDYQALINYFPSFQEHYPKDLYLMGCTIYKGARHQIRAHAAYAGFPLFNDLRYINNTYNDECFLLHNKTLVFDQQQITCEAPWDDKLSSVTSEAIKSFTLKI